MKIATSVDDLLEKELGWRGFGPAQAWALLIGGLAFTTMACMMFQMTFTYTDPLAGDGPPAWRCVDPNDEICTSLLAEQNSLHLKSSSNSGSILPSAAGPPSVSSAPSAVTSGTGDAGGDMPPPFSARSFCDLDASQYVWLDPSTSLSSEYNLVCGQKWKASLLETLFFAGFMTGNGVFGAVADRHGRRATLAACSAATAALTALAASPLVPPGPGARAAAATAASAAVASTPPAAQLVANGTSGTLAGSGGGGGGGGGGGYWVHLVFRCLSGIFCAGQALGAYVLATEMVGPAWRGAAGMLTQTFYIFGEFLLVGLSLAFPPWRHLSWAVAAACALVLLGLPLVPESPRWLLLQGRPEQARAALLWVARVNRCQRPPSITCTAAGELFLLSYDHPDESPAEANDGRCGAAEEETEAGKGPGAAALEAGRQRRLFDATAPPYAAAAAAFDGGGGAALGAHGKPYGSHSNYEDADEQDECTPLVGSRCLTLRAAGAAGPSPSAATLPRSGSATVATTINTPATPAVAPAAADLSSTAPSSPLSPAPAAPPDPPPAVTLLTALAHPATRRLLLSACFVMFSLAVAYFGVTLALGSLVSGSLHLNFLLMAAAELPGYLAIAATTDRLGRRMVIGGGTALAGVACLACAFTSGGPQQVVLAMVGKLGCSGAWAVGLTFASELFPTCLRSAALSVASQSGDLGGLVSPPLLLLSPPGFQRLPFAVMGLMSLAAVALVWKLPETRGMPQLDTFEELLDWLGSRNGTGGGGGGGAHALAPAGPILTAADGGSLADSPRGWAVQSGAQRSRSGRQVLPPVPSIELFGGSSSSSGPGSGGGGGSGGGSPRRPGGAGSGAAAGWAGGMTAEAADRDLSLVGEGGEGASDRQPLLRLHGRS